ncbi:hypothetical protein SPOG_03856 [Schizosaccharomyces cryophilus OY26]|uniref:Uncharacterized protein n=1 Tax=Schizosaccharomyces cryophilus (strain OY26 / ATCC MYA-4695 / CBS 11777 / NBRC 106824 / NRRL Y48691) TaxID=653667 RepID=S9W0I1_SCHCR|nr:uncharacterized protein SPOG_03856 [Schizosaccharomyces cryophilus OY26]EPY53328.1 hypothetical protein SPOG_03856 [Schizosaccharomyces cryophilus OY26]
MNLKKKQSFFFSFTIMLMYIEEMNLGIGGIVSYKIKYVLRQSTKTVVCETKLEDSTCVQLSNKLKIKKVKITETRYEIVQAFNA